MKKRNTRILASYSECRSENHKMNFVVNGRNTKGGDIQATIVAEWYFIPYFIDSMKQAWDKERTRRINEINSIDESLPKS